MDRGLLNQSIDIYINKNRVRPLSLTEEEVKDIAEEYFIKGVPLYRVARQGIGDYTEKRNYASVRCVINGIKKIYQELTGNLSQSEIDNKSIKSNYQNIKLYVMKNQSKSGTRIIYGIQTNFGLSKSAATKAFHKIMDDWCYPTVEVVREEAMLIDGYTS